MISTGNLSLVSGATLTMEINGNTAGTLHDQVKVTGSVNVAGATLSTTFGFTPSTGQSFILIDNDAADPVTGTFNGLAEGETLTSGGRIYKISYAAGTGNDVVLTDMGATSTGGGGGDDGGSGSGGTSSATPGRDLLVGTAGSDSLAGLSDNDTLSGGAGADRLFGGLGADLLARLGADADGYATLDLGAGNTVTLIGVQTTALTESAFLIA